ncbi:hypothetical protein [Aquibacillus saliphilus]|uniref:hypothetical protein n=1 Tax=Aquibacillus saliphilus TaxID=1909422 RepID=UPI001CF0878B|nr:hypothetical protein [Aquibacillus saliphilus]
MTLIMQLLPLIIMIGLIVVIVVIVKKNDLFRINQMSGNKIKWVLSIYGIILLASIVVFFSLPDDEITSISQVDSEKIERSNQELYNRAHLGTLEQSKQITVKEKWQFDVKEQFLQVTSNGEENQDIIIFVERKESNDGEIDVVKYATESLVNHGGYQVELNNNKLIVQQPDKMDYHFAIFTNEFSITQFTGEKRLHFPTSAIEAELLYIRIPKDLELTGEVQFVEL